MVPLIVLVTAIAFIAGDYAVRQALERREAARVRTERENALANAVTLKFEPAASLKRAEVESPRARILAVDDEDIVLDSFRKILVLEGYSVDTVNSGPEALTLVQQINYDFVFTDLKMPVMDGVEVTKAVRQLRPDVDIVIITGYATIESAVETMKFGAVEYVQKPFTGEELASVVRDLVIRREDRIARHTRPVVLLPSDSEKGAAGQAFSVLPGLHVSGAHVWAALEPNGLVRLGLDDFVNKFAGPFDRIEVPREHAEVKRGSALATLYKGDERAEIPSPVSGRVKVLNRVLLGKPAFGVLSSYDAAWLCALEPADLAADVRSMRLGKEAVDWYESEADAYMKLSAEQEEDTPRLALFAERFFPRQ